MGGDLLGQKEVSGGRIFLLLLLSTRGAMATAAAAGAAANLLPSTLCELHNKPLNFFCQNELALICTQCAKSKKHHAHTVLPIEEAAQKKKVSERLAFLGNFGISCLASHSRYVLKKRRDSSRIASLEFWLGSLEDEVTCPAGSKSRKVTLCKASRTDFLSILATVDRSNYSRVYLEKEAGGTGYIQYKTLNVLLNFGKRTRETEQMKYFALNSFILLDLVISLRLGRKLFLVSPSKAVNYSSRIS